MIIDEIYFGELRERREHACTVTYRDVSRVFELASPICHDIVDGWVKQHPNCEAVRGWLIETDDEFGSRFVAHSVIRIQIGNLIDITPFPQVSVRPTRFLVHRGTEAEWAWLRVNRAAWYWPPPK